MRVQDSPSVIAKPPLLRRPISKDFVCCTTERMNKNEYTILQIYAGLTDVREELRDIVPCLGAGFKVPCIDFLGVLLGNLCRYFAAPFNEQKIIGG